MYCFIARVPRGPSVRIVLAMAAIAVSTCLWQPLAATAATDHGEQQELIASNAAANQFFGSSVDMSGDALVVSAPDHEMATPNVYGNGAAYVYRLVGGSWQEEATLTASDGFVGQLFGGGGSDSAAIAGDTIVLGAQGDDSEGPFTGAAYVFERVGSSWNQTAKLTASDAAAGVHFGQPVSIDEAGDVIVVGAPDFGASGPGAAYVYVRNGTGWEEQAKLTASDGAPNDQFGFKVEVAQDTIAVSAWFDDHEVGSDAGAIYVFRDQGGTWVEEVKLVRSDGQPSELLGWAMEMSPDGGLIAASTAAGSSGTVNVFQRAGTGWTRTTLVAPLDAAPWAMGDGLVVAEDTILVGFSAMNDEAGGALIYRRSGATWTLAHRLVPSDGTPGDVGGSGLPGDWAGTSVAMSGGNVAIGAPWHDDAGESSGSVYMFQDPGWDAVRIDRTEQQELRSSSGAAHDHLGASVDLDDDTLVAGAPQASFFGEDAGTYGPGSASVYRFSLGAWHEEAILTAADGFDGQLFAAPGGDSVAVAGDTIVIGAQADDDNGASSGAAYVFERTGTTWIETAKLAAADAGMGHHYGQAVSISGDANAIVVGAPAYGSALSGAAYVYVRSGAEWVEQAKLTPSDGAAHDEFGVKVEIAHETIAVSSWGDDNAGGVDAGAIYVYGLAGSAWEEQDKLTLAAGQSGERLGWAMEISPDAGTIAASTAAGVDGGVYVFQRSGTGWDELQLTALPDLVPWAMGDGLAVSSDAILVGHSALNQEIGGAHLYRRDGATWSLAHRFLPSDGVPGDFDGADLPGDWAGTSVAMSGGTIAVGSPWHDHGAQNAGSVYVFPDPGPGSDADVDGMSDDLETGFGGADPSNSIAVTNPETGDVAYGYGSAEDGATIYSGSFGVVLPPGTTVDEGDSSQIEITLLSGPVVRVEVSGADLGGGTKSILMPFDGSAAFPAVCIDDAPTATLEGIVLGGDCSATSVAIPDTVGATIAAGPYTVTRLHDFRVQVDGLSHTVLATLDASNASPIVVALAANAAPVPIEGVVTASAAFLDLDDADDHIAVWSWGDGASSAGTLDHDANTATAEHHYAEPGVYTVSVTLTDRDGAGLSVSADYRYVVVYDPDGGFVTGGGWIDSPEGALAADPTLTGKATFGFVAKYKPGRSVPEGSTEFQFKAADLNFKAQGDFEWLTVSGSGHKATFRGTGTINGAGTYGVTVTVIDAANTPSTDVDFFRIKIIDKDDGDGLVYDNQQGTDCGVGDEADPCTAIGGGNIKIHKN